MGYIAQTVYSRKKSSIYLTRGRIYFKIPNVYSGDFFRHTGTIIQHPGIFERLLTSMGYRVS